MLTVKKLSLNQASTYYSKDNYYTQQVGEFYGKLKDELGLDDLTHDSFNQLLQGIDPATGESLVASKANKKENVPAFDFTFSPSKSISIAYELAMQKGNMDLVNKLLKAHDNAVNTTLSHIQDEVIQTRAQKNKKRKVVKTGSLIAAKFQHDINRNLEPQLHTHSVLFNLTEVDGKYRSIDASNFLKKGSKVVKNIGQFYRQNLKQELMKAGFELRDVDLKRNFYELKNIDDNLIQAFSSRSKEIKLKAKEIKKLHPKLSESQLNMRAFFNTRASKKDVNRDQVRVENIKLLNKHTNSDDLLKKIQPKQQVKLKKVDEKEIFLLLNQAKQELNKWHKTPLSMTNKVVEKLGNVDVKKVYEIIKNKETKDKQKIKTMHDVVVIQLAKTKLDTKKLFKNVNINKYQREEILENARSNRDRFIIEFSSIKHRFERENGVACRNDEPTIAARGTERGRDSGAKFERDDAVATRDDRSNREISWSEAIRIANRGDDRNQYEKGFER